MELCHIVLYDIKQCTPPCLIKQLGCPSMSEFGRTDYTDSLLYYTSRTVWNCITIHARTEIWLRCNMGFQYCGKSQFCLFSYRQHSENVCLLLSDNTREKQSQDRMLIGHHDSSFVTSLLIVPPSVKADQHATNLPQLPPSPPSPPPPPPCNFLIRTPWTYAPRTQHPTQHTTIQHIPYSTTPYFHLTTRSPLTPRLLVPTTPLSISHPLPSSPPQPSPSQPSPSQPIANSPPHLNPFRRL